MSCNENNEYFLNWNDHMNYVRCTLASLFAQNELVDVTLCCEGGKLFAHKMLLSVCSRFFLQTFKENPCPHPIVILKGVNFKQMKAVLKFMYDGEVSLEADDFDSFLKTAKLLEVHGLSDCGGVEGFKQTTLTINSDVENIAQCKPETENLLESNSGCNKDANVKEESSNCQDISINIQEQIEENINTIDFTEMQVLPPDCK